MTKKLQRGYMFLYQLLISCWVYYDEERQIDTLNSTQIKQVLTYAVEKYKNELKLRKDININDYSIWILTQHIKKFIPEMTILEGTIYGQKRKGTEIKTNPMFKIILLLERENPTNAYNPIFKIRYPTDSILKNIIKELNIKN